MKKSTKIKLIRALTSSTDYTDKDKLRLIKNLLDETLPSSTIKTDQLSNTPKTETGGTINVDKEANQFLTDTETVADVRRNNKDELLINKLPQKLADRVTELYDKDCTYETLPALIEGSFIWSRTLEGEEYWQKLYKLITHFQTLPQPYQDQAIKNINMDCVNGSSVETPKLALLCGFEWKHTGQGEIYWGKLHNTL